RSTGGLAAPPLGASLGRAHRGAPGMVVHAGWVAAAAALALAAFSARSRRRCAARSGFRLLIPISFRTLPAIVSDMIAAFRRCRFCLLVRALSRCEVIAWCRLTLPVLVTLKRLNAALFGLTLYLPAIGVVLVV